MEGCTVVCEWYSAHAREWEYEVFTGAYSSGHLLFKSSSGVCSTNFMIEDYDGETAGMSGSRVEDVQGWCRRVLYVREDMTLKYSYDFTQVCGVRAKLEDTFSKFRATSYILRMNAAQGRSQALRT